MFSWPTPDLTEYEKRYVRMYKEPILDAQGKDTGHYFPGLLRRMYKVSLNNVAIPGAIPYQDSPHLSAQYLATRRTRVFALTFFGDVASWYLNIKSQSGETYTKDPCLVSSMCAGTPYDADAAIGEPLASVSGPPFATGRTLTSYGLNIDPNWVLEPNDGLNFDGTVAPGANLNPDSEGWPYRILVIGIHVWEFPEMSRETLEVVKKVGG